MKNISKIVHFAGIIFLAAMFISCEEQKEISSYHPNHWEDHYVDANNSGLKGDSLQSGKTYLSIYSHIYSFSMEKSQNLTAMVSLRNVSETDTIYISKADYYGTEGQLIRHYFKKPIYLKPLETVEIVIDETDQHGGSGANFIFEWTTTASTPEPLFEAIMTSLRGAQGLSFTTVGRRIK
ncbi:DUF3124 domain-containing protein [Aequorivita vladivostokensis]|uniref:Lipoprotein n=1 Tax=Aequorivita vladivostokensis TaxID=171194 RepID=A0ABR5DMS6_9FLAO|nr:DUF3124 domain-containing protein [Aequorivita vladivostokensis]KJJ40081.1 hypothetical protein MB09_02735 [Aequorivita vladivostokensis]MAB56063.1 DUF3124 domain-containing protein [Aequorivita sp.]MBF31105.1 DUF3124 domain-containing protein [Aequorivita sp.]|tara:strand:- start:3048 stop:3587 length:540 start_codon:yes stop_codon:yes gene_type:complete